MSIRPVMNPVNPNLPDGMAEPRDYTQQRDREEMAIGLPTSFTVEKKENFENLRNAPPEVAITLFFTDEKRPS